MSQDTEYNPDNHFVRRSIERNNSSSPMSQLEAAAEKHKQRVAAREAERMEEVETYRNTLVGKGGYGQNSILGQYFNTGLHQADKAVQGAGWVANAPIEAYEGMMRSGLDEGAHEAYTRVKEDEARFKQLGQLKNRRFSDQFSTGERVEMNALGAVPNAAREGDQELLAQQPESGSSEKTAEIFPDMAPLPNPMASKENPDGERDALTNRERLERADGAARASDLIREAADNSNLIDQTDMNDYVGQLAANEDGSMERLREGWASIKDGEIKEGLLESADAAGSVVANAWNAAGDNKLGFFQTISGEITEDLAPLAVGGATGQALNVAQNASYALDSLNSGRENFIAKHGREPDGEEMGDMMTKAMLAFGVNQVGDVGLSKAIKGAGKAVPRANGALGTAQNVAGAAGRTAAQTGGQAVLEGVETYASGEAAYDPASDKDIVVAASIGGGMGATVSVPDVATTALGVTADVGRGVVNKATKGIQKDAAKQKARIEAGSPGDLANVDSEDYNPREAMEVIAKADGRAEVEDSQKQRNREFADHIVTNTRADLRQLDLDIKNASPKEQEANKSLLAELKAEKDALADGEDSKMLDAQIGMLEKNIERAGQVTPAQIKEMKTKANQLRRDLPKINAQYEQVTGKTKITPEEMDGLIGKANGEATETAEGTPEEEGATEAAEESNEETTQRVYSMIARDPMSYSADQLDSLASGDNGLTDGQRNTLRRLSKAKVDENLVKGADDVSDNVLNGADGYKGTRTYLKNIAQAKQNVNPKKIEKEMKGLREFAASRRSKLEVAQQAQAQAKATGEPVQIVLDNQSGWKINDGEPMSKPERDRNGAGQLEGDTKGDNYVNNIATDTQVVESALAAADAMTRPDADITPMEEKQIAEQRRARAERANARIQEAANNAPEPEAESTEDVEPEATTGPDDAPASEQETADAESDATAADTDTGERTETETAATDPEPDTTAPADNTAETEADPEPTTEAEPEPEPETEPEAESDSEPTKAKVDNDGGLTALDEDIAVLQESNNPTQRWVRQSKNNGEKSKQRPLRGVRDFLSAATSDNSLVMRFLNDREFSGEQVDAVDTYMATMRDWVTLAKESLSKRNLGTVYPNDLAEGLVNEDGTYDENLATAIASAGYLWTAEQGSSTQFNDDPAINKILSRPTGKTVNNATRERLAPAGDFRNLVINNLGKRVIESLGLKVDPNAPSDVRSRLESSLGAHAYNVLVQQGIITETVVSAKAMNAMKGEGKPEEFKGKRQPDAVFARLTGSTQVETRNPEATAIADSTKGSQNILNELLGVEASKKIPSFKPLVFAQKLAQKSMRAVSRVQTKALKKHSQKAYVVRNNDMGKVADVLRRHEGVMQAMAGHVDMDNTYVHPDNEMGVKGKNDSIEREVDDYFTMMDVLDGEENGRETKFYLGHNVWINQRTGMANSLINLQNSKVHRHLVQMDGWQDVDVSMDATDPRFIQFQLAVADSLGIKTDGMSREKAIAKMEAKMAEKVMQDGVVTLQKMINDIEPTDQDIENLQAAVAAGKENFHSLDGLMAYAQYDLAFQAGESSFTHGLTREIDGKTNGPMLTQILTGAAKSVDALNAMVQKGGFFTEDSGFTNVNEWAEQGGNYDLYQSVAEAVGGTVRDNIASTGDPRYNALFSITDPLLDSEGNVTPEGRGATKTPVTEITFGSAVKNTIQSMAEGFSNELTAKVEKIVREAHANGTSPDVELAVLSESVETLTGVKLSANQLMNKIPKRVTDNLEMAYTDLMGEAIEAGINSHYESFLSIRDEVTDSSRTAFDLYDILYEQETDEMRKGVNKNKANKDIHDLTPAQYAEVDQRLKAAEPIAHTAMSKMDGNLEAGFSLYKDRNQLSGESTYQSEVHFGESGVFQPYLDTNTGQQKASRKKSTLVSGMQRKRTDRGVGVMVMLVHSLDSAIAVLSFRDRTALNVHDALIVSASKAVNQAKLLNSNTFKVLLDYSPNREVADAFGRTVSGFLAEMQNGKDSEAARKKYAKINDDLYAGFSEEQKATASGLGLDAVGYKLLTLKRVAKTSDITKLEAMQQWQNVDQYSLEEGQYELSEDDHVAITKKLNERRLDDPKKDMDAAKQLGEMMGTTVKYKGEVTAKRQNTKSTTPKAKTDQVKSKVPPKANETERVQALSALVDRLTSKFTYGRTTKASSRVNEDPKGKRALKYIFDLKKVLKAYQLDGDLRGSVNKVFNDPSKTESILEQIEREAVYGEWSDQDLNTANRSDWARTADDVQTLLQNAEKEGNKFPYHAELIEAANTLRTLHLSIETRDMLPQEYLSTLEGHIRQPLEGMLNRAYTAHRRNRWGELSYAVDREQNDNDYADEMRANHQDMTFGTAFPIIKKHLEKNPNKQERAFNLMLLRGAMQILGKDFEVHYIVGKEEDNIGKTNARFGRYAAQYSLEDNAVTLKDSVYAEGQATPITALHELVHAATSGALHEAENGRGTPATKQAVKELEELKEKAKRIVTKDANSDMGFFDSYGVTNTHELLAVGMTDTGFQNRVLKKVQMQSSFTSRMVDGTRKLAEILTRIMFKGTSDTTNKSSRVNGMEALINNFAILAEETQKNRPTLEGNPLEMQGPSDPLEDVDRWNSYEVFEALENSNQPNSSTHKDNMRRLLDGIVTKLHGPAGVFMEQAKKSRALSPEDVLQKANDEGVAPFSSQSTAIGFNLTPQESLVLEQVEATVAASLDSSRTAYKELAKVFQAARKQLSEADFHEGDYSRATDAEKAQAKKLYDHVFKMENDATGKSGHLSRFAALALAHEPLRQKLKKVDMQGEVVPENASLATRIQILFNQMLNWINQRLTKTADIRSADKKVETLVDGLVHIEAKRRRSLASERYNPLEFMEGSLRNVSNKVSGTIAAALDNKFLRENRYGVVRGTSAAAGHLVDGTWKEYLQELQDFRSYMLEKRQGLVSGMVTEMMGEGDGSNVLYRLHRVTKTNEMLRDSHIRNTTNRVLDNFDKAGKKLTNKEKAGLTYALLRTDASSLLEHHSVEEVQALLLNDAHRKQMRRQLEAQISELPQGNKYVMQASDLAHFMATGVTDNPMLQLNAHGIAHLYGLEESLQVSPTQETIDLINQYTTLAAIDAMPSKQMAEAKRVIEAESQRGADSGVAYALRVANDQRKEAEQRLFSSNPTQMVKGYVKEITDPNVSIVAATAKEGEELVKMGYEASPDLLQDPSDKTKTRQLYVLEDGGSKQYLSGAISLSSQQVKGTTLSSQSTTTTRSRTEETARVTHEKRKRLKLLQTKGNKRSRSFQNQTMVPVFNPEGQVVDYRYMMSHQMRDSLLRRNNNIEDVMGSLSGQLVDRQTGPEHNRKVVQTLKDVHASDYAKRPSAYLTVGPRSEDPKLREAYRMLPVETRQAIKEIWGDEGMKVRDDLVNLMFGYRKYSLGEMIKKADNQRNIAEKATTFVFKGLLGDKAGARIHRFEDILKTISGEIKDNLVVKNLNTLRGNVSSNATQLLWHGVDPGTLAVDHKKAVEGAMTYRRDNTELQEAQERKEIGYKEMRDGTNIDQRIGELRDSLARNPSTRLIESGMLPTIVEDIDMINDPFSYQSKALDKVDKYISKTPKALRTVGKQVYMTHDTASYKFLSQATQLSDYAARYTLYQHVTTRKQNPLSHADAMDLVMDSFVNYDIPTPKAIQYLNDVGVLRFTKYYLRIQRVIMSLFRDKPMRGLAMLAAENYLDVQTLMDSSMMNSIGNPIDGSVLDYKDSVEGIATVDALTGFFQ